jgi:F0F1-type ATP synthase membrane subunit c/vacuolar-type H+-ATPase subunit K
LILKHEKTRWLQSPAGLCFFSGRLLQAIAVRRHGFPMMMVVAVMAEALHLFPS